MNNKNAFVTLVVVIILIIGSVSALYVYDPKVLGLAPSSNSCTGASDLAPTAVSGNVTSVTSGTATKIQPSPNAIKVVAAENFWGSLISQLGGNRTSVTSIITDPNTDPHEYESDTADAVAISTSSIVIVNGQGYDQWAITEYNADHLQNSTLLNVQELLGLPNGDNPHMWYNPYYVNDTVHAMYEDLAAVDPSHQSYYYSNYQALNESLAGPNSYMGLEAQIRATYSGTAVASTESIFVWMANATGLDLVSPTPFIEAVAAGIDPPSQSVVAFQNQLENGSVKALIYNIQTVTPLTACMLEIAGGKDIPIVRISETIQPPGITFQEWMLGEVAALDNALNPNLGQ
jgi:zinc/manganese transport system substrate-binding protein